MPFDVVDNTFIYHTRGGNAITFQLSDTYNPAVTGFTGSDYYYGYLNEEGNWLIIKETVASGQTRYAMGQGGTYAYADAWAAKKTTLTFALYNAVTPQSA